MWRDTDIFSYFVLQFYIRKNWSAPYIITLGKCLIWKHVSCAYPDGGTGRLSVWTPPPPEKSQKSGFQQYWSGSMDPDKIFLKGVHVCVLVVHFKNIESFFLLKKCLRQSVFYQRRLNIMNIVTLFIVFYCKNTITQFWREQRPLLFFFLLQRWLTCILAVSEYISNPRSIPTVGYLCDQTNS